MSDGHGDKRVPFRFLKTGKFLKDQVSLHSRKLFEAIYPVIRLIIFLVTSIISLLKIVILENSLLDQPTIFEELDKLA